MDENEKRHCVSLNVAELLKLKGFGEKCWYLYEYTDVETYKLELSKWIEMPHCNSFPDEYMHCTAPSQDDAIQWIADKYKIQVNVNRTSDTYESSVTDLKKDDTLFIGNFATKYDAKEEALTYILKDMI